MKTLELKPLNEKSLMVEAKAGKITATVGIADQVNANGRLYPLGLLKREVAKLQEKIKAGECIALLDHPDGSASKLGGACVKWTSVTMDGDKVIGQGIILATSAGNDLRGLLDAKVPVEVSSRGAGSTMQEIRNGVSIDVVQPDFELLGFDLVANGSTGGTRVSVVESQRAKQQPVMITARMAELAGVRLDESGQVFNPGDGAGHGIVSDSSYEVSDQPHSTKDKQEAQPDFPTRLAAAIQEKFKRTVTATLPISDNSWVCLDGTDQYAVTFTRNNDGSVTITGELRPLDQYMSQAVDTFRSLLVNRLAVLNQTNIATESKEAEMQNALMEKRMLRLAGIIEEEAEEDTTAEPTEAEKRMLILAGLK